MTELLWNDKYTKRPIYIWQFIYIRYLLIYMRIWSGVASARMLLLATHLVKVTQIDYRALLMYKSSQREESRRACISNWTDTWNFLRKNPHIIGTYMHSFNERGMVFKKILWRENVVVWFLKNLLQAFVSSKSEAKKRKLCKKTFSWYSFLFAYVWNWLLVMMGTCGCVRFLRAIIIFSRLYVYRVTDKFI